MLHININVFTNYIFPHRETYRQVLFEISTFFFGDVEFPKTRPDDFKNEIKNIIDVLDGNSLYSESPINFKNAVKTHKLMLSSFESNDTGKVVYF